MSDVAPMNGYEAMRLVVSIYGREAGRQDLVELLTEAIVELERADVLAGLSRADAVTVGTAVIADLIIGGVARLYWRAEVMHGLAGTDGAIFDDLQSAVAAQAHVVALMEMAA